MKKLLIGLLTLGSVSSFATEKCYETSYKNVIANKLCVVEESSDSYRIDVYNYKDNEFTYKRSIKGLSKVEDSSSVRCPCNVDVYANLEDYNNYDAVVLSFDGKINLMTGEETGRLEFGASVTMDYRKL